MEAVLYLHISTVNRIEDMCSLALEGQLSGAQVVSLIVQAWKSFHVRVT